MQPGSSAGTTSITSQPCWRLMFAALTSVESTLRSKWTSPSSSGRTDMTVPLTVAHACTIRRRAGWYTFASGSARHALAGAGGGAALVGGCADAAVGSIVPSSSAAWVVVVGSVSGGASSSARVAGTGVATRLFEELLLAAFAIAPMSNRTATMTTAFAQGGQRCQACLPRVSLATKRVLNEGTTCSGRCGAGACSRKRRLSWLRVRRPRPASSTPDLRSGAAHDAPSGRPANQPARAVRHPHLPHSRRLPRAGSLTRRHAASPEVCPTSRRSHATSTASRSSSRPALDRQSHRSGRVGGTPGPNPRARRATWPTRDVLQRRCRSL